MNVTTRNFPHAMLREIFEQPSAIAETLAAYADQATLREDVFLAARQALVGRDSILIAASGSSRHAGLAGEILFEDLAGIAVDVEYASEYIYRSTQTLKNPCFVVISQSGETADTSEALREAIARGSSTIAITNKPESSMAKLAACSLPTYAGVERAVPATKSFTTQLVVVSLLALYAARVRGRMTRAVVESHLDHLFHVPEAMEAALPRWEKQVSETTTALKDAESFLFLGRGVHYPMAREGALKLKESAYIQAEGYPTGELKHGPNALVSRNNPLVVLATCDPSAPDSVLRYEKTVNLVRDMHKQGAQILSVVTEGDTRVAELSDHAIEVPRAAEYISPLYEVVPLQLLAYFMATARGIDVDNPRNLVKAVVQE
ncbi:SIS domain-containing protein [Edaphobacter albus]|uniref:SIS domain-containing protein n=1 Tax=Edaphobacter sp. 4G125 TaxID=2763071 RepID=UPI001646896D|nr:SIS domain-containing protein [Edaphobacter sp. 4G125]QNI37369.1 SIS domain-containing protein [Edaphobacter sp. 4G125]